ncbi:MAG: AtpZ/AtpI family protein [Alphaproteobacteria bacterium]|nr:AtpZ/AtpI family protein [Alphaproteobacteria bacterium]
MDNVKKMSNTPEDIKKLEERIKQAGEKNTPSVPKKSSEISHSAKVGVRVITDLLSAIFIGGCMGYFLDDMLDTKPFMLIFLLLCGAAAGFLNIYRFLKQQEEERER